MLQRKIAGTEIGTGMKVEGIEICGEPGELWAVVHLSFSMPSSLEGACDVVDVRVKVPGIATDIVTLDQIGAKALEQAESVVWQLACIHEIDTTSQSHWDLGVGCYRNGYRPAA